MAETMPDRPNQIIGLFIGSGLSFSDTTIRLATEEISCIAFHRLDSFSNLFNLDAQKAADVRLIIVDEALANDFQNVLEQVMERFTYSRLVFAYRDRTVALRLIENISDLPGLEKLGFLPMKVELERWLSALRLLAWGERYIPADLFSLARLSFLPAQDTPPDADDEATIVNLTARECQVLGAAAEGKQNKIIAEELGLSQHTVKLHMHHVIVKLGVSNRTEATLWYLSQKPRPNGLKP